MCIIIVLRFVYTIAEVSVYCFGMCSAVHPAKRDSVYTIGGREGGREGERERERAIL